MNDTHAEAIEAAVRDVHRKWSGVFSSDELQAEAALIREERSDAWPSNGYCRTDTRMRLLRWVESELPSRGFARRQVAGVRKWRRLEWPASHCPELFGVSDSDLDRIAWCLKDADWPPMTESEGRRFARIILSRHAEVAAEFMKASEAVKPPRMHNRRWDSQRAEVRARLRVRYAAELAQARFEAMYGRWIGRHESE